MQQIHLEQSKLTKKRDILLLVIRCINLNHTEWTTAILDTINWPVHSGYTSPAKRHMWPVGGHMLNRRQSCLTTHKHWHCKQIASPGSRWHPNQTTEVKKQAGHLTLIFQTIHVQTDYLARHDLSLKKRKTENALFTYWVEIYRGKITDRLA